MPKHEKTEKKLNINASKSEIARTAVALLLAAFAFVFLLLETTSLYFPREIYNNKIVGKETVENISLKSREILYLSKDTVAEQTFKAQESEIFQFRMYFWNKNYYKSNGNVEVTLLDKEGKELAKTKLDNRDFRHNRAVTFDFTADSAAYNTLSVVRKTWNVSKENWKDGIHVTPGEEYTIRLSVNNITKEEDFGLYAIHPREGNTDKLKVDGQAMDNLVLCNTIVYGKFAIKIFIALILMILMTAAFVVWLFIRNSKDESATQHKLSLAMLLVTPILCYWMNYKIADKSTKDIVGTIITDYGRMNFFILTGVVAVMFIIFNSTRLASIFGTLVTYIFLGACYLLIEFRDAPLRVTDFYDFGAAMDVADNYSLVMNKSFLFITIVVLCFIAANLAPRLSKTKPIRYRSIALLIAVITLGSVVGFIQSPERNKQYKLRVNAFYPTKSYGLFGYAFAFALSFRDIYIDKPEGYSKEEVEELAEKFESDKAVTDATVSEKTPNIIAIMNEAYSDLSMISEIKTNEPYMPFFDSLEENAVKGTMYPSIFGGGTANTEFEFLTGNTLTFLNLKTAYTSLIKQDRPSLARTLAAQGYKGMISFHPGVRNTYNRDKVYPYLGFDKYVSIENLDDPKLVRQFVSDEADYEEIIKEYEEYKSSEDKDNPFFMFNVTIQNHGAFGYSTGLVDAGIKITDPSLQMMEIVQTEQFLNLMKKSDDAFKMLIEYFEKTDEPTIIVMFGDHQPRIEAELYDELKSRLSDDMTDVEKSSTKFQVPFIIWANYDIEEEKDVKIGANALAPYMLDKLNLGMTGYDKFLVDLRKSYPVTSKTVFIDSEGTSYAVDVENLGSYKDGDKLLQYHYAEYNNMKDKERVEDFYKLKE